MIKTLDYLVILLAGYWIGQGIHETDWMGFVIGVLLILFSIVLMNSRRNHEDEHCGREE